MMDRDFNWESTRQWRRVRDPAKLISDCASELHTHLSVKRVEPADRGCVLERVCLVYKNCFQILY